MTWPRRIVGSPWLRRMLWFAALTGLVFIGLWISPLGTTSMQITVTSSTPGASQMFFADTLDAFTPLRSSTQPISVGNNTLRFDFNPVSSRFGFYQRWDPCDCVGEFTVQELAMRSPLMTRVLPLERLQPGPGVSSLTVTPEGAQIATDPATVEPQVFSSARLGAFYALNLALLAGLAVLLAALLAAQWILVRYYFATASSWPASTWRRLVVAVHQTNELEAKADPPGPRLRLPTTVTVTAGAILAVNIGMVFAGAVTTGVSIDEPTHVSRLQSWLDSGWYLPAQYVADGSPAQWVKDTYVYAPVMALLGHVAAVMAGAEGLNAVAVTAEAYAARHVAVALVGALGLAGVAGIARVLLGSWRWGLLAAAALSAVPMWTGHAMFNIKDTPVSTGYTLASLGLIALSRPAALTVRMKTWLAIAILTGGIVIAVGTRPGMWTAIVASTGAMLLGSWWAGSGPLGWANAALLTAWRAGAVAVAGIASLAILLAVYPKAFADPVTLAWQSAFSSGNYDLWNGWTITAGIGHGQPPPWWYVPIWLTNQLPILLLAFAVVGLVFGTVVTTRTLIRRRSTTPSTALATGLAVILTQALLMPVLAIVMDSRIYSGIRQLLFIVPAWALLATIGIWWCYWKAATARRGSRTAIVGVGVVTAVSLLLPTFDQARLFPYNYAYFNEVAALQPINGRWATDYWRTSLRELAPRIPKADPAICSPPLVLGRNALNDPAIGYPLRPGPLCATYPTIGPYSGTLGAAATSIPLPAAGFWYVRENQYGFNVPENCRVVDQVTRPLRQQSLMMSYLARCETFFADYPPAGVVLSPEAGSEFLLDGWALPVAEAGAWSVGEQGRVGVTLPEDLRGRDLSVVLTGSRLAPPGETRDLRVLVNDEPVADVVLPGGEESQNVVVEVPAEVAERLGDGRLLITVQTPDPVAPAAVGLGGETRPLGFLLESLSIGAGAKA